jgi:IclR family pca regulon transcriptional regulator
LYAHEPLVARTPRTITSLDDLLLALDEVARQGYALANEELEIGYRSISAPVFDRSGKVVAAINVSTATGRVSMSQLLDEMLPQLVETAGRISRLLGWTGSLKLPSFSTGHPDSDLTGVSANTTTGRAW